MSHSINEQFLLWIESSHRFLMVEEPIHFVLTQLSLELEWSEISRMCARRYELSITECAQFVQDIVTQFEHLINESVLFVAESAYFESEKLPAFEKSTTYQFGHKSVTITSQTERIHQLFHSLFSHLETTEVSKENLTMQLFLWDEKLCIRTLNGDEVSWSKDDIPHFKGDVMGRILNFIYEKSDNDWMMTLHSSGVTNGRESILFTAAAGSGKSTMAALLQANGYELLSDDFVAVDLDSKAYRFDMQISVKRGALDVLTPFYPELVDQQEELGNNGKMVRYLSPKQSKYSQSAFPVTAIVFVNYDSEKECELLNVPTEKAVKDLLAETFVYPSHDTVLRFMTFVQNVRFYALNYSDSQKAVAIVSNLFSNEK
ncbi:MAG: hypothetical protein PHV20_11585 [Bacteroidales bacterium]|nr:hypothetical protein [Bacteroidales bacterium]